jgi:hypothetical protein
MNDDALKTGRGLVSSAGDHEPMNMPSHKEQGQEPVPRI